MAGSKFQSKNTVLTKKLNNVLYELMVKTQSDMVYIDDHTTLTERLAEITDLLVRQEQTDVELKQSYERLVKDANNNYDSFNCFRFLASVTLKTLTEKEFMLVLASLIALIKSSTKSFPLRKIFISLLCQMPKLYCDLNFFANGHILLFS